MSDPGFLPEESRKEAVVKGLEERARELVELALRESQARSERQRRIYEAILANTPDLAYVWDLQHRFIYANEGLLKMWGKTRQEAIGRNCLELGYEPWHAEMHDREIDQVAATGKPIRGEVPFAGTFGRRIYDYILVPVFNADGEVEAVAGTTRDITDQKESEQALRTLAAELAESDRRKDEFLAMLAHELRNPLAPILNALQILQQPEGDHAAIRAASKMMERQVVHMARLVDDLLDVSRISRGKIELRREPVELAALLQQAVEACAPAVESARHQLTLRLPPEPVYLEADALRLAQVFSNLLHNACKFSPSDGRIEITCERRGGEVAVAVQDRGIGIQPEQLAAIFEMFTQADRSLDRAQGGLGIGLTLVKTLVEMHGGSVEAESEGPGCGSRFVVRLPLLAELPPVAQRAEPAPEPSAGPAARRILVVDDNQDAASSLALLLRLMGHETRTAFDGQEAVEAASEFDPEVVFLDIGLPKLNGYEVCRRIRVSRGGKAALLVALTGWGKEEDRRKSAEAGFDEHLVKPVEQADLARILARPAFGEGSAEKGRERSRE